MKNFAIIVAGGKGLRMNSKLPKQFLELEGIPILVRTLQRFKEALPNIELILVINKDYVEYWMELEERFDLKGLSIKTVTGGASRFHSVLNGLNTIETDNGIVGIHDAVRPMISPECIRKIYSKASINLAVIPVVVLKDSIRKISPSPKEGIEAEELESVSVNRSDYRLVQTPQCFELNILRKAYEQDYTNTFTDDASVVESIGQNLTLTEGEFQNIKITTQEDMFWASSYMKASK